MSNITLVDFSSSRKFFFVIQDLDPIGHKDVDVIDSKYQLSVIRLPEPDKNDYEPCFVSVDVSTPLPLKPTLMHITKFSKPKTDRIIVANASQVVVYRMNGISSKTLFSTSWKMIDSNNESIFVVKDDAMSVYKYKSSLNDTSTKALLTFDKMIVDISAGPAHLLVTTVDDETYSFYLVTLDLKTWVNSSCKASYNMVKSATLVEPEDSVKLEPICGDDSNKYCEVRKGCYVSDLLK